MKKYLMICFITLFLSCEKQDNLPDNMIKGKIVGYLKCTDTENNNSIFGICIISNDKDSIISFNVPSSILDLLESEIDFGVNELFNGDSVQFSFRSVYEEEIKQFDCPPTITLGPSRYPFLDFTQVVIIDINRIE